MRRLVVPKVVLAMACLAVAAGCNDATEDVTILQATLSGANEVPPRGSSGNGAAGFIIDGSTVHYSLEVHGVQNITQAHIHSGAEGVNGPVRVFLFGPTSLASSDGVIAEGSFTAQDVSGVTYDQLLSEMQAGTAYVNVHTTQFPGGEVRGQTRVVGP